MRELFNIGISKSRYLNDMSKNIQIFFFFISFELLCMTVAWMVRLAVDILWWESLSEFTIKMGPGYKVLIAAQLGPEASVQHFCMQHPMPYSHCLFNCINTKPLRCDSKRKNKKRGLQRLLKEKHLISRNKTWSTIMILSHIWNNEKQQTFSML